MGDQSAKPYRRALWVGLACFFVYVANCRAIIISDAIPATVIPLTLIRGEGILLDRFQSHFAQPSGAYPYFVSVQRNHLVSNYPVSTGFVASIFVWPQILVLDRLMPGWDSNPGEAAGICIWMAKLASAALGGVLSAILVLLGRQLGLARVELSMTAGAALGSNLWMTASQTLWPNGAAALMLALGMLALMVAARSRLRLLLGSGAVALMVCCRISTLPIAIAIAGWIVKQERARSVWFWLMPAVLAPVLLTYNLAFFGSVLGGASYVESANVHRSIHAVSSGWSGNALLGAAGTLVSPSRGLFLFSPWIPISIALLPLASARIRAMPMAATLFASLPLMLLVNSAYSVWWGGHSFGPRYWTEVIPIFAVMLGLGLDWSRGRSGAVHGILISAVLVSIAVQSIGAFCYPSGWNRTPLDVDRAPGRLWNWRDTEVSRCLRCGPRPLFSVDQ